MSTKWGTDHYSICPPSLSAAAEFRISLCEMRHRKMALRQTVWYLINQISGIKAKVILAI